MDQAFNLKPKNLPGFSSCGGEIKERACRSRSDEVGTPGRLGHTRFLGQFFQSAHQKCGRSWLVIKMKCDHFL